MIDSYNFHSHATKDQANSSTMSEDNPLREFFRQYDSWIKLPSNNLGYYPPEILETNEDGEVGVMPMTGNDEILMKNPDALLNGEAIKRLIKSCCPSIKKPEEMIMNDIEALIVAIRKASYGDVMDMEVHCPKCNHKNTFGLNLEDALDRMTYLDDSLSVVISHKHDNNHVNLRIHLCPHRYNSYLQLQKITFEEEKILRSLQASEEDTQEKLTKMSNSYQKIAQYSFQMIAHTVIKITSEDSDMVVENPKHILEFMNNISRENSKKISSALEGALELGINKNYNAKCESCNHVWEERIILDPSSFF